MNMLGSRIRNLRKEKKQINVYIPYSYNEVKDKLSEEITNIKNKIFNPKNSHSVSSLKNELNNITLKTYSQSNNGVEYIKLLQL